ncbi:MAG: RNA pseudouridine synthase, partial [Magnetococcales bacterium]|nr:RNA pseudouridine synthase [Magnetococcales bacterium]
MNDSLPAQMLKRVLYQDAWLLVLDKPAGIAVHGGPGNGLHIGACREKLGSDPRRLPELAHRLDRLTSGCLVFGRHRQALRRLGKLFAAGLVEKCYWAIVLGKP